MGEIAGRLQVGHADGALEGWKRHNAGTGVCKNGERISRLVVSPLDECVIYDETSGRNKGLQQREIITVGVELGVVGKLNLDL